MWYEYIDNKIALTKLYNEVPELSEVIIKKIELNDYGPDMLITIELPKYPDFPPQKWIDYNFNHIQIEFLCISVTALNLQDWQKINPVNIILNKENDSLLFKATGNKFYMEAEFNFLRVNKISGYLKEV